MSFENAEVRAHAARLAGAPNLLQSKVGSIVEKGALNVKNQHTKEMQSSTHFRPVASSISYDMRGGGAFGGGFVEAEIGPVKGSPGSLANVAYFGTSRGGGTVADPRGALEAEAPQMDSHLGDAMIDAIEGG